MKTKKYRIKSKFRFTVFIASLLVAFVFLTGSLLGLNDVSSLSEEPVFIPVQIESGDTLWAVASQYSPSGMDYRQFIFEICQINDIQADSVYPGQTILIPQQI